VSFAGGLSGFGGLVVIDTTTNIGVNYIAIPGSLIQSFYTVAISPDNTKVYANATYSPPDGSDVIAIIDPSTESVVTTIPPVMSVGIFSPDGKHLYIPDGTNSVAVIDTSTNTVSATVSGVSGAGAIAIVPAPSIVPPLHAFEVSKLDINVHRGRFELESELLLEASSSGLDPVNQPVRLQVGPFITTIPAGSFTKRRHGYDFEGVINDVHLSVTIRQTGALRYAFDATVRHASLAGVTNPVQVSLNINTQGGGLADVRGLIEPARHDWDD